MNIWTRVELLQALLFISVALIGRLGFRLPWAQAAFVGIFTLPAPLIQITAGAAGFVYGTDIAGCALSASLLLRSAREPWLERRFAYSVLAALFLLVLWPAASTLVSMAQNDSKDIKLLALAAFRGVTYIAVFASAILLGRRSGGTSDLLAVSCLSVSGTCLLGLVQQGFGVDLDLWNRVREIDPTAFTDGFGGGFMGLYRGAVGAWSAGVLAILPVVWLHRKHGWLATGLMSSVVLAATVQTGSRQGVVCGVAGLLAGLLMALFLIHPHGGRSVWSSVAKASGVMLLLGAAFFHFSKDSSLQEWIVFRFKSSLGDDSLVSAAINRETKAGPILEQLIEHPSTLVIGVGKGTVTDDVPAPGRRFALVYVDSELLWILQQGGLVQLLAYLAFLFALARRFMRFRQADDFNQQITQAAALSAVAVGTALSYGHFFLLHVQSTQAPIAYWNWAIIGLGLAAASRSASTELEEVTDEEPSESELQTVP